MPKVIQCPKCQTRLKLPPGGASTVACPECKTKLRVGGAATATATATTPQPSAPKPATGKAIQCPKCRQAIRLPSAAPGQQFKCPGCQALLTTPATNGSSAPVRQPKQHANTRQTAPASNAIDFGSLPSPPDPGVSPATFGSANPPAPHSTPYASGQARAGKEKRSKMNPALKRFVILAVCTFVLSAIPLLGLFLGFVITGISCLTMIVTYFWIIALLFEVDSGMGVVCLLFPVLMGRYIRDDWRRYRRPATLLFTALGCAFVAFAALAIQIFVIDSFAGK